MIATHIPRYQVFLIILLTYICVYAFCLFSSFKSVLHPAIVRMIAWSPIFAIFAFGIYALYTIMKNVISLKNYPDEAEKLLADVAEAKDGLRKRGYKYDLLFVCLNMHSNSKYII